MKKFIAIATIAILAGIAYILKEDCDYLHQENHDLKEEIRKLNFKITDMECEDLEKLA